MQILKKPNSYLVCTVGEGHLNVVRELLARGGQIGVKDGGGQTALHRAAQFGHLDVVRELLTRQA